MKLAPVKAYPAPSLPTWAFLDAHPELLHILPRRWQGKTTVIAALMAASLLIATQHGLAKEKAPASHVAPIFQHGLGMGAFGCMAVNPPLFLSEADARKVIDEEMKRADFTMSANGLTIDGIHIPLTNDAGEKITEGPTNWLFALDGADAKHRIAYTFISNDDFEAWKRTGGDKRRTAYQRDYRETARVLQKCIDASTPDEYVAVFYEPAVAQYTETRGALIGKDPYIPLQMVTQWLGADVEKNGDDERGYTYIISLGEKDFQYTMSNRKEKGDLLIYPPLVHISYCPDFFVPARLFTEHLGLKKRVKIEKDQVVFTHPESGEKLQIPLSILVDEDGVWGEKPETFDKEQAVKDARIFTESLLRSQVQGFLCWLKAQGAI